MLNGIIVSCRGRSGLALLWKRGNDLSVISYSKFHIVAVIDEGKS